MLDIGTGEEQAVSAQPTNFLVARVKRDILRRSSVGLIGTLRTPSLAGPGSNTVVGVDANLAFYQNVQVVSYYARSDTPGRSAVGTPRVTAACSGTRPIATASRPSA